MYSLEQIFGAFLLSFMLAIVIWPLLEGTITDDDFGVAPILFVASLGASFVGFLIACNMLLEQLGYEGSRNHRSIIIGIIILLLYASSYGVYKILDIMSHKFNKGGDLED